MKIAVDEKGWTLVTDGSDTSGSNPKPGSGVFAKSRKLDVDHELGSAATEPCPESEAAIEVGSMRFPAPPSVPTDLAIRQEAADESGRVGDARVGDEREGASAIDDDSKVA